jgi:hypothetical protein
MCQTSVENRGVHKEKGTVRGWKEREMMFDDQLQKGLNHLSSPSESLERSCCLHGIRFHLQPKSRLHAAVKISSVREEDKKYQNDYIPPSRQTLHTLSWHRKSLTPLLLHSLPPLTFPSLFDTRPEEIREGLSFLWKERLTDNDSIIISRLGEIVGKQSQIKKTDREHEIMTVIHFCQTSSQGLLRVILKSIFVGNKSRGFTDVSLASLRESCRFEVNFHQSFYEMPILLIVFQLLFLFCWKATRFLRKTQITKLINSIFAFCMQSDSEPTMEIKCHEVLWYLLHPHRFFCVYYLLYFDVEPICGWLPSKICSSQ